MYHCNRIGGPRLLKVFNRAGLLPSIDHKLRDFKLDLISQTITLEDIKHSLKQVVELCRTNGQIWWSILVDDIHCNKKIRYSQRNNKIVGLCYEHTVKEAKLDLSFNDMDLITSINTLLSNGTIHHADQVCTFSVALMILVKIWFILF